MIKNSNLFDAFTTSLLMAYCICRGVAIKQKAARQNRFALRRILSFSAAIRSLGERETSGKITIARSHPFSIVPTTAPRESS